jgi:hypothetical protein
VVIAAAEIYEGTAAHLREGGHELPPLESADLDDVLASVTAAVAAMRVSSSMIDTAAALRRERMEGVAS